MTHGFTGLATAAGAAAAFFELGKRAAESTIEAKNQATVFGTMVEKFEGPKFAASQTGISGDRAATAFERFSVNLGRAREASEQAAEKAAAAVPRIDTFAESYRALTTAIEESKLALDRSSTGILQANQSVESAQRKLSDLNAAYHDSNNSAETDARLKREIRDAEIALTIAQQRAKEAVDAHALAVKKLAEEERKRAEAETKHNNELRDDRRLKGLIIRIGSANRRRDRDPADPGESATSSRSAGRPAAGMRPRRAKIEACRGCAGSPLHPPR
jgi:hypothetical protein